jgi:hypothetical protein
MGAPAAAAAAPAAAPEPEPEPVVEEKTSFDVKLLGIDSGMKVSEYSCGMGNMRDSFVFMTLSIPSPMFSVVQMSLDGTSEI